MAYLKALGILRLVSEQKDPDARSWWANDVLCLRSTLDRDALMKFFQVEYRPTPIVAPWAGGSGFFKNDNKKAVQALGGSAVPRISAYTSVIQRVQEIIEEENVGEKPKDDDKVHLIRRFRCEMPDELIVWMDAAMVLQQSGQGFSRLLGTGGNDGRLDFTQNFMQRVVSLRLHKDDQPCLESQAWLAQALFALPAKLDTASVGQFAPGRAGGPNATQGMEGDSTDNPWDFILMIEGTLMLAGAAVRRFGVDQSTRVAFPFIVRTVAAGFDSSASKDEAESRREIWLPLWDRPTKAGELRHVFGEGRADVAGRPAKDGTDFARAVAGLGVDRGVDSFTRLAFLKRSGKAFLAVPIGRFHVAERWEVDLLREIDPWFGRFRSACSAKDAPARFGWAVRQIDSAVFDFCRYGGSSCFQQILIALGRAERELANAERFREEKKLSPIAGLATEWVAAANVNDSPEFKAALALAGIYHEPNGPGEQPRIGPLRANLEAVDWKKRCRAWAEKDRSVVWNAADLSTNLANVLQRRMMGAERGGKRLPLASRCGAPLDTVVAFIAGDVDDHLIEELLWGLMLVDVGHVNQKRVPYEAAGVDVPRAYALLKLLFLPRPLVVERWDDGRVTARLTRGNEAGGITIRPEPAILHLIRGQRLGEACSIAMRRLRASGFDPMPKPIRGRRVRDNDWRELEHMGHAGIDALRLAAALLIPIQDNAVSSLVRLVTCGGEIKDDRTESVATMNAGGDIA